MNILYITTSLNPPNGVCARNVLCDLSRQGHNVACYTQGEDVGSAKNAEMFPVFYSNCSSLYRKKEKIENQVIKRIISYLYRIWLVICYPIWPLNSILFYLQFRKQANKVARENKIDLVVAEYGDIACLLAGVYIKRKNKDIKYIAYFLDALYCGATPRFMKKENKEKKSIYWENRLLDSADGIVMMKSAEHEYSQAREKIRYYDRITFLDIPMILPVTKSKQATNINNKQGVTFLYVGSMPRNIRNPQYFLELFLRAANADWKLMVVGTSDYENKIKAAMLQNDNVLWLGKMPHSEIENLLLNADILVNIGNSIQHMVPSKIFEYISAAKPIISTYRINEDSCLPYLSKYEHSILIDERLQIEDNVKRLQDFANKYKNAIIEPTEIVKLSEAGKAFYYNTPQAFSAYVEELYAKN